MDQIVTKKVVCISKHPEWVEAIKLLFLDETIIVFENSVQAILKLSEISNVSFVFVEPTDIESDKHWIAHIRKQVSSTCFIVLIKESISPEDGKKYLSFGINDFINPKDEKSILVSRINFLKKHGTEISIVSKEINRDAYEYKMPTWKRVFDLVFVSIAIILLIPVWIIVPLAILLESPGKVIYKSKRVGTGYKVFGFYKFRSMYLDADSRLKDLADLNQYVIEEAEFKKLKVNLETKANSVLYSDDSTVDEATYLEEKRAVQTKAFVKLQNDPRVTRIGRIIRKLSVDELPQLFNVLKGEMSIVGNRPLPLYEAELLTTDNYLERFLAPAGLTGLWQVEKRGQNSRMSPEERKLLDVQYARNYTFWGDIKIILKTIPAMIQKEDV
jgi:lipopolysaccharide/colanic/teichoic acid biosynthesis glycosyltransferase